MERLTRRAEFKAVARGRRVSRAGFTLQALAAPESDSGVDGRMPRFGFTVTKQTGNSVVRNRIRRRLREVVRAAAEDAQSATDYVLVGRRAALTLQFAQLVTDLRTSFAALSRPRKAGTGSDAR